MLCKATAGVSLRRLLHGPICKEWNFITELSTEIARRQLITAFEMIDVNEARRYLDALVIQTGTLSKVSTEDVTLDDCKGTWLIPNDSDSAITMLYLHGGGYSFYPKSAYRNLGAAIATSAKCRVFAMDYRLSPEHRFPAQLTDASNAYRWLLRQGVNPEQLVVIGDSAGGNLTLALILSLRDLKIPLPALAIGISPATDFGGEAPADSELEWITSRMAVQWADWFCSAEERLNPLVSPVNADLRGLPPIYIQAGGAEILLPGIQMFVKCAKEQGADVTLEIWPAMNHDFQLFGEDVPQSAEAIRRIGEVIGSRIPEPLKQ